MACVLRQKRTSRPFPVETQELAGCPICFFGHDLP
jgi:hypothetical protein